MKRLQARLLGLTISTIVFILVTSALSGVIMTQTTQEPAPFPPPNNEPAVVTPGQTNSAPPSDAVVLFDGKDMLKWRSLKEGGEAKWQVKDGYVQVVPSTGDIATKQEFGDCQLHIEWATPAEVKGEGQGRGNSGIFLMERYEVQVLDSYPKQDLLSRASRGDLQAIRAAGQREPQARRVAGIRHHIQGSEVR